MSYIRTKDKIYAFNEGTTKIENGFFIYFSGYMG